MTVFNAAVIGTGRIGFSLELDNLRTKICTHSAAYNEHPDFKLVAGADINPENLQKFSDYYKIGKSHIYSDYRKMIKDENIDVVSICSWTNTHKEIFCSCMEQKNIKAVFLEKPPALNLKDAEYMLKLADKNKKTVAVNYERRWEGRYNKVKEIIQSEQLGNLRCINGNVLAGGFLQANWHKHILKRGGPLLHDGVHLIDIILYFCGFPKTTKAKIYKFDKRHIYEHTAFINFEFKNNINAFLEIGGRRKYFNFEIDLQFESGRIIIGNAVSRFFITDKSQRYSGFTELKETFFPDYERKPHFIKALDEISSALSQKKHKITSSLKTAIDTMKIIKKIYHPCI
ncbi:Gfo/Idh/MocA family oxidoreductase [Candidatus Dependentiae bacterium]|nr:Gfo/Idh/MocA family oxidoreductase [Candidatus Dependentiae bacterium]